MISVRDFLRDRENGAEGGAGSGINQMLRQIEKHSSDINSEAAILNSLLDDYIGNQQDRQAAKCAIAGIASANRALQALKVQIAGAHA